jgi:hypothetical protein
MNKPPKLITVSSLFVLLGVQAFTQPRPPRVYIDKGACPFEGCTYRTWKTKRTTVAYARPDRRSEIVGKFKATDQEFLRRRFPKIVFNFENDYLDGTVNEEPPIKK